MSGNLRPFKAGEPRAAECGRKGGIASGVSRRATLAELVKAELETEFCEGGLFNNERTGLTKKAQMVKALVRKATHGDAKSILLVLKLLDGAEDETPSVAQA